MVAWLPVSLLVLRRLHGLTDLVWVMVSVAVRGSGSGHRSASAADATAEDAWTEDTEEQ